MKPALLALAAVALLLLHQDFWNWTTAEPLLFGVLPVGLWYHAAYSFAASAYMGLLVLTAWPRGIEKISPEERR